MNPIGHPKLDPLLQALRDTLGAAAARGTADMTAVDRVFTRFGEQLGVVLDEHAGMTDELLRAYEQLGIVFEVTRKLSTVQTERQVVRLFVDSLRITYSDHAVCLAIGQSDDSLRWLDPPPHTAAIEPVVRASAGTGKITVSPLAGIERAELMVAPIFSGSEFFGAIVITHDGNTRAFEASDMSLVEALTLFCGDILRNYQLANELRRLSVDMVRALVNAIDQKDEYTSGHSNRVGYFATLLGRELGLDEQELQMLEWAALLHDVGKIGIRDDVLKKPGKLTPRSSSISKSIPSAATKWSATSPSSKPRWTVCAIITNTGTAAVIPTGWPVTPSPNRRGSFRSPTCSTR
jgi:HD-GYP domain-containing protein (c-di-GMP phosphodiesterase class II)